MTKHLGNKSRIAALVLLAGVVASCSGGDQGLDPLAVQLFNFAPGFGGVHLNASLEITFTVPVDPTSVNSETIRIFTTTTTTEQPDPGAPAIGVFVVSANVVTFKPRVPEKPDLSDAGLRLGFTYNIDVPASPDVIAPVRSIEGDPNMVPFTEFFTTLNTTILPAPADITAEPNLNSLSLFFVDEGIQNGVDPCPRGQLPLEDQDSPQVIFTDPSEGESGFGTITGIQVGLGTAFVRMDPITIIFGEPIGPWRIRPQNISIRNTNLGGENFDLFFFFQQDRSESRLQITVFDADSAFDQASVPQGRYVLSLTAFTDLAGNPLVNESCTGATGSFNLSFSTVSSPALPTDLRLSFDDDDGDGHVDVGGLLTAVNDPNIFPVHMAPFLGGVAVDQSGINPVSPSNVSTTANWGSIGFWTGCEVRLDNGFDPLDPGRVIPAVMRLRGGTVGAATPILAPIAGNGGGASSPSGSADGQTTGAVPSNPPPLPAAWAASTAYLVGDLVVTTANRIYICDTAGTSGLTEPTAETPGVGDGTVTWNYVRTHVTPVAPPTGKVNFSLVGSGSAALFTGDLNTGPITYNYFAFELVQDPADATARPLLTARADSIFPLMIFVETDATISGDIMLDGGKGDFGWNGPNDLTLPRPATRNPGGAGGNGIAGAGDGGYGGAFMLDDGTSNPAFLDGQTGSVPANVLGPLDQFSEMVAGLVTMSPGGGGHWCFAMTDNGDKTVAPVPPNFQGGGGSGTRNDGTGGTDFNTIEPGCSDQGVGGKLIGTGTDFSDSVGLAHGGSGGGGGGADDDSPSLGSEETANNIADTLKIDDGGGGGGAGGGFLGFYAGGDIILGEVDNPDGVPDTGDETFRQCKIHCNGGRGGSTYATVAGDPPVPGNDENDPDENAAIGSGNAGGGGGGGGICMIAGDQLRMIVGQMYAFGRRGGNAALNLVDGGGAPVLDGDGDPITLENGGRAAGDTAGNGGGGVISLSDVDGFAGEEVGQPFGTNQSFILLPDPAMDLDVDGVPDFDPTTEEGAENLRRLFMEQIGGTTLNLAVYGDDPREVLFQATLIVTEFFDTLSDSVSYDRVQLLSNLPRFVGGAGQPGYDDTTLTNNPLQVVLDVTATGAGGAPDLSTEDGAGNITVGAGNSGGNSRPIGFHFNSFPPINPGDPAIGEKVPPGVGVPGVPQYDSTFLVPAGGAEQGRRFVRVRLLFDLSKLGTLAELLGTFAPPGAAQVVIADDPGTTGLDNTLGNIDTAPDGVLAFAEVRVRFTP